MPQAGIDLAVAAAGGDAATPGAGVILDSAALKAVTKDQRNLFTRQHELLAAHLKLDFRAADEALLSAQSTQSATEAKLDLWNNEHGELYGSGISSTFNSLKVRVYDSSWNWVREDVMSLYYDLVLKELRSVTRSWALEKPVLSTERTQSCWTFAASYRQLQLGTEPWLSSCKRGPRATHQELQAP
jgi:fatty acid synthase subunit alpha